MDKNTKMVKKQASYFNSKPLYLVGLMFCITLLMCNFASALELNPFANSKTFVPELKEDMSDFLKEDFNSKYGVIQLSKTMFWVETDRIAEYSVTENTDQCLINCETRGKAVLYTDGKLFDDKYFLNKKGIEVEIDSQYYIKENETYYEDVPQYKEVCSMQKIISNSTIKGETLEEVCNQEIVSYDKVEKTKEVWNEYNFETLKAGEYEWKIIGSKNPNQDADFIPSARGKNFNEWVWWNSDWKKKVPIIVSTSDTTSRGNISVLINVTHLTGMQSNFGDLRFLDSAETEELGYWFYNNSYLSNNSVQVYVKMNQNISSTTNATIYLYFDNGGATTTSEVANAGLFGDDFNGASVDFTNKWQSNNEGLYSTSGGRLITTSSSVDNMLSTKNQIGSTYIFEQRAYTDNAGADGSYFLIGQAKTYATADHQDIASNNFRFIGFSSSSTSGASANTYYRFKGQSTSSSNMMMNITSDSGTQILSASGTKTTTDNYLSILSYNGGGNTAKIYVDWVFVSQYTTAIPQATFGSVEDSEGVSVSLSSPVNAFTSSSQTIFFNATITPTDATIKNVTLYLNGEEYLDLYDTNETINYSKILSLADGSYTWNITACFIGKSLVEDCTQSETRTFNIDATPPTISVLYPTGTLNYGYIGQNISLNYSVSDASLDSCWATSYLTTLPQNTQFKMLNTSLLFWEKNEGGVLSNYTNVNISSTCDLGGYYNLFYNTTTNFIFQTYYHYYCMNATGTHLQLSKEFPNPLIGYTLTPAIKNNLDCSSNSSFFILPNVESIYVYANDTVGNTNYSTATWDYRVFENSLTYNPTSFVTTIENFRLNITTDGTQTPIIYLVYNGSSYLSTLASGTYQNDITILNSGNNSFYYNISYGPTNIITDTRYQMVADLTALEVKEGACSAGLSQVMNFTFYDEANLTALTGMNVKYNFKYGVTNSTGTTQYGTLTNVSQVSLCLNTTQSASYLLGYGEIEYDKTDYVSRRYYVFQNTRATNVTIHTPLYDLLSASSTSFLIEIIRPTLDPYIDRYTTLLRWYPNLNEYRIVEMGKTDDKGQTVNKVKIEDVDYRIGVYDLNGTLIHLASPIRMVCLTSPCSYTLTVSGDSASGFDEANEVQVEITYTAGVFTLVYNDPSQNTDQMQLNVYKISGTAERLVCQSNSTAFTGILTCDVSAESGLLKATAVRTASPFRVLTSLIIDTATTIFQGTFGLFLQFLIITTLAFLGIVSPIVSIILGVIALAFGAFLFKTITYPLLIAVAIMGGIVIHFMRGAKQ